MGIPDGISMPFIIMTGLSAVSESNALILTSGIATTAIGAMTLAAGAYFTTRTEIKHFNTELESKKQKERDFLAALGIQEDVQDLASEEIMKENLQWSELLQHRGNAGGAGRKAIIVAGAHLTGGVIPMLPYLVITGIKPALLASAIITFVSLVVVGYIRGRITELNPWMVVLRTVVFTIAGTACAYGVVSIVSN